MNEITTVETLPDRKTKQYSRDVFDVAMVCVKSAMRLLKTHWLEPFKKRFEAIEARLGNFAAAERVAGLGDRCRDLEKRLADYEKRLAHFDNTLNAHRTHLGNLEKKIGGLIHGEGAR